MLEADFTDQQEVSSYLKRVLAIADWLTVLNGANPKRYMLIPDGGNCSPNGGVGLLEKDGKPHALFTAFGKLKLDIPNHIELWRPEAMERLALYLHTGGPAPEYEPAYVGENPFGPLWVICKDLEGNDFPFPHMEVIIDAANQRMRTPASVTPTQLSRARLALSDLYLGR